jgi:hypothetical protein
MENIGFCINAGEGSFFRVGNSGEQVLIYKMNCVFDYSHEWLILSFPKFYCVCYVAVLLPFFYWKFITVALPYNIVLRGCGTWFLILIEEDKLRYYSTAEYLDLRGGMQTMCITGGS